MSAGKSWVHERCGMVSERGLLHMGNAKERIESGKAVLGIEFGSTRIKAVLVDETHQPIASGAHDWENQLVDGIWTYSLDMIWDGLRDCYRKMTEDVQNKYGVAVTKLGAIGFSGMMHGYMPFDEKGELLVPFRTWRNTITGEAAAALTKEFSFNIPQRWSIAHLYQAILNGEEHGEKIDCLCTLAGFIHWTLSGQSGRLEAGIPLCPPEGDAGTGMAATNSVAVRTGNVSAGTSVFAMVVLEEDLKAVHEELDMVTTPSGDTVAMVHCNNCTSDLNAWVGLFREFAENFGINVDMNELFGKLYNKALEGDKDCGGLLAYNYFSGEPVTGANEGRPLFVRKPDAHFNLANFMRTHLYAALATLKIGLDILLKEEKVKVDRIYGHGGLFKTKGVGQGILAAAMDAPVAVMETAGEGGPWGMALLASYMLQKADGESLEQYLSEKVFGGESGSVMEPDPADVAGFDAYIKAYKAALAAEKAAVEAMPL